MLAWVLPFKRWCLSMMYVCACVCVCVCVCVMMMMMMSGESGKGYKDVVVQKAARGRNP